MKKTIPLVLIISFCAIALCSVSLFCRVKISNTLIYYLSCICTISVALYFYFSNVLYAKITYILPTVYFVWTFIEIIRGCTMLDSYWVTNQFIHGVFDVMPLVVIFPFFSPYIYIRVFQPLNRFIVIFSIILAGWCIPMYAYPYFLVPFFYLYSCFISKIPRRWFWITLILTLIVCAQIDNRSSFVKAFLSFCILILSSLPQKIRRIAIDTSHWFFYSIGFILLWLGLSGRYNVFDSSYFKEKDYTVVYSVGNDTTKENNSYSTDTRTFIYVETITTALDYDCVWTGRSPAHGYISPWFTPEGPVEPGRDPQERHASEVALLNTFTWLGLVGVILLTLVFIQGTSLALYASNNKYVKCIAVWCAFQWLFSWIENINEFHLMDIMIYCCLAICYSPKFRQMSDLSFEAFFKSLFEKPGSISTYEKFKILRTYLIVKAIKNKHALVQK